MKDSFFWISSFFMIMILFFTWTRHVDYRIPITLITVYLMLINIFHAARKKDD